MERAWKETKWLNEIEGEIKRLEYEKRKRLRFFPHLYAITDFVVNSFFSAGMNMATRKHRGIDLPPEIIYQPEERQIEQVRDIIVAHYDSNKGMIKSNGNIKKYYYCFVYNDSMLFSVKGELVQKSTNWISDYIDHIFGVPRDDLPEEFWKNK